MDTLARFCVVLFVKLVSRLEDNPSRGYRDRESETAEPSKAGIFSGIRELPEEGSA